ncbi:MAG TPA: hypothetical protein VMY38_01505 [Gemmatimonadaceae bacterium]|nr:hypothetical protein [Gemmatimonadaceae bacterium]
MHPARIFLAVVLLSGAGACGDDTVSPASVYGTYALQTVDAKALPALLLREGDYTFEATAGSYLLRENGTFTSSQTWREQYQGWSHVSTHSFEGTFSISGSTVTFVWPSDGATWTGTLEGRELSVTDDDQLWVYRKG